MKGKEVKEGRAWKEDGWSEEEGANERNSEDKGQERTEGNGARERRR